jgi:hypothetical protein
VNVPPTPPSQEEIQALAEAWGITFDMARWIIAGATLSETELPGGQIIDA